MEFRELALNRSSVSYVVRTVLLMACAPLGSTWAQSDAAGGTGSDTSGQASADRAIVVASQDADLQEVTVTANRLELIGNTQTASQGVVNNDEITLTPAYRPSQVLETVPSLDVTIHSGEGKAPQYLLRGYNLDHGTDLALFVDDMPVNMPSHAHGQGYADINYLIPELATDVNYTKGTYYAEVGDFGSVGSVHINYLDKIPTQVSATIGTLDFQRYFAAGSTAVGNGNVLAAFETQHYDGPWTTPGEQKKINGVLRYSTGDARDGYSLTAMFYHDTWNAQTDEPLRALTEGLIPSVYGMLDPTDGGYAQRASLSLQSHASIGDGQLTSNAYVISNRLSLWNNFTHFLVDPIDGDQEWQHEDRIAIGGDSAYSWSAPVLGAVTDWEVGVHGRFDFNDVSRIPTKDRVPLTAAQLEAVDYPSSFIENDNIRLNAIAGYVQATSHWTDKFRSVIGLREDYQHGNDVGTWYGSASKALFEPKGSLIYRASESTEFYASAGVGYHSDDLRGVNQARIQNTYGAPLMARQVGEELGMRQELLQNRVSLTLALYNFNAESETKYNADVGQDSAGPGSHRDGFEINLTYQATHWLEFYGSYSGDKARYTSANDDGNGHLGNYLVNAPFATGSFNVYLKNLGPWSGGLFYRYLSAFPLTSGPCANSAAAADFGDGYTCANAPTAKGQVFGHGYGEWNAELHYEFQNGLNLGLGGYNLLNKKANSMEYYYVDRLRGEADTGVADLHFHPLEPLAGRLTIAYTFK